MLVIREGLSLYKQIFFHTAGPMLDFVNGLKYFLFKNILNNIFYFLKIIFEINISKQSENIKKLYF
jgi:hypothetical protein